MQEITARKEIVEVRVGNVAWTCQPNMSVFPYEYDDNVHKRMNLDDYEYDKGVVFCRTNAL